MSDLIEDDRKDNAPEYTVSELSGSIKRTLEGAFGRVRVRGEIGRVMRAGSGHLYYDLKDDKNVINCNTWKGQVSGLTVLPEEGLEVIVTGRLSTFGPQSKYNLNVDQIEVAGEGALMAMLEKRRKALAAEGLFASEHKKKLPYLPEIIGVVTSPSGAVIRDILHRLRDRFPRKVLIWPVAVQGQNSAVEVARAIRGFNTLTAGGAIPRPDLLIVARGGGSLEDLWGFNEEIVVRAAAASDIPLISAVGHETDTTLIDFASDVRAPTPTAAAELAVPVRLDLLNWVREQEIRLSRGATQAISQRGQRLRDLSRALPKLQNLLDGPRQRLDRAADRLPLALRAVAQKRRVHLSEVSGSLRPGALRRLTAEARRGFLDRSQRLKPDLVTRVIERNHEKLDSLVQRFAMASTSQLDRRRTKLEALDRTRLTLGYTETLKRGYAVVRGDGAVVTTAQAAGKAASLEIEFTDGKLPVAGKTTRPGTKPKKPPTQGSLF